MKISGLQIDEFGIWSGLSIDSFPDGAFVFFGANEAGKSTLLQFIRAMLYGFSDERSRRFVQHRDANTGVVRIGGRIGGSLSMLAKDQQYHVRRHASLTDPLDPVGEVRIASRDGDRHGANRLNTLLSGIDETIFNNVFAVGLEEMQHLGTLDDTQAARFLYSLSTGTDRVSLVDVMRQLQTTRARLIGGDAEESYLGELLRRKEACVAKIQRLGLQGDQWSQMRSELERLNDEVGRLESSREKYQVRSEVSELAMRVQPCWERHRQLKLEVESLGQVKRIPDDAFARIATLDQEIAGIQGKLDQQEQHRHQLQRELAQLSGAGAVTRQLARIEALIDQTTTITGLHDQVQQRTARVEESEFEVHAEQERLGIASDERGIVPRFDSATFTQLREPARQMEHLRELLEHHNREAASAKEEEQRIALILAETLGKQPDWFDGRDESDIIQALEQTSEIATALRRRSRLQKHIGALRERSDGLVARQKRLLLNQLLPWEVVKAIGAMFALGAFLAMWAFFGDWWNLSDQMRTGLGVMGGIGLGFATLLKITLQHASRDALDACLQKTDDAETDLESAENELLELDRKIPSRRSAPIDLQDAETQVVRLESLLPMEGQRRRVMEHAELAAKQASELEQQLRLARQHWEQMLESLGISRRLTPTQVRELAGESGNLVHLHRRHEEAREAREHAFRELEIYRERMRSAMSDAGIGGKAGTALDELGHLQLHVNQNQQQRKQRESVNDKIRRAQREQQETQTRIHELQRRRQSILTSANAVDDDDLRQMMSQRHQYDSLVQQAKEARGELRRLLACDRGRELKPEFYSGALSELEKGHRTSRDELDRIDVRLKELIERRAQVAEQLRSLNADRQIDLARMELGVIEAKLLDGIEQWKIISAITALLRQVYKRYEKERQPETLQEASQHLSRMTCGKYTRIWTPLDEDVLVVEEEDGQSWTVDQMSRGTREQLFLALRLALVSGYAKRGICMPLVLDDVLVNFDEDRTKAAAEVLVDFAQQGHQMLVFTCHQHVMKVFEHLGATAQPLPSNKGQSVIAPVATPDRKLPDEPTTKKRSKRSRRKKKLMIGYSDEDQDTVVVEPFEIDDPDDEKIVVVVSSVDDWTFAPAELPDRIATEVDRGYVEQVFDQTEERHLELAVAANQRPQGEDVPVYFDSSQDPMAASLLGGSLRKDVDDWDRPQDGTPVALDRIDWYSDEPRSEFALLQDESPFDPHHPPTSIRDDWADEIAELAANDPLTKPPSEFDGNDDRSDELPQAPLLSEQGQQSAMDVGIVPDWKIETRLDEPQRPTPRTSPEKFVSPSADDWDDESDIEWRTPPVVDTEFTQSFHERSPSATSDRKTVAARRKIEDDPVLDLDSAAVVDIAADDLAEPIVAESSSESPSSQSPNSEESTKSRDDEAASAVNKFEPTVLMPLDGDTVHEDDDTRLETSPGTVDDVMSALGLGSLAAGVRHVLDDGPASHEPPEQGNPAEEAKPLIRPADTGMLYSVALPPVERGLIEPSQSDQRETTQATDVFSSTSNPILPIVLGGSTVELSQRADPNELVDENKEEHMSIVDRFVSRAVPQEAPIESSPVVDAESHEDALSNVENTADDESEYEYVDVEVDENDNEVAIATGDIEDGVEYEYEYVEDEDGEVEYEYVEVEVDEDGNEIEASAVKTDEDVEEEEYEYVYVDEDEDEDEEENEECEVATATGDVEDGVEYEYEYVEDDEEDDISAEADDDEYEDEEEEV